MKNLYFVSILFITILSCDKDDMSDITTTQSESFVKFFGSYSEDEGVDVVQTKNGGYAILGNVIIDGEYSDICLIITDEFGNTKYPVKFYGGEFNDKGRSLEILPEGGFLIIGAHQSEMNGFNDIYIIKTDSLGDLIDGWPKTFGGSGEDVGTDIKTDIQGNIICVGYITRTPIARESKDIWLYKMSSDGSLIWSGSRVEGFDYLNEEPNAIAILDDSYIITGTRTNIDVSSAGTDIFVLKFNLNGIKEDIKSFGGSGNDEANDIYAVSNDEIYITGSSYTANSNTQDIYILKIDDDLNKLLEIFKHFEGDESGLSIVVKNQITVIGNKDYEKTKRDALLLVTQPDGATVINKQYGTTSYMTGNSIKRTADNGYIIVGSNKIGTNNEITLIKTNSLGEY